MFALVQAGTITQVSSLPRLYYDGARWWDWRANTDHSVEAAALGWLPVVETARPADTQTTTYDYAVQLIAGVPTEVWTERPKTAEELAADEQQQQMEADRAAIVEQALVWLAADSVAAATRVTQITAVIADIDAQIAQVTAYTFAGATVAGINTSLNSALKPMIGSILARQKQVAQALAELNVARDKHGDALVWVGRYLTS